MPPRQIAQFYRQMYATANAGVPTSAALSALAVQTHYRPFQKCLQEITREVWQGLELSTALRRYPKDFSPFHCAVIRHGEATGTLAAAYQTLAVIAEREGLLQDQIKRELLNPKVTLICTLPFVSLLGGSYLTLIAAILLFGAFGGVLLVQRMLTRLNGHGSSSMDVTVSKVPWLGPVASMITHAQITRSLATAYASGLGMPEALHLAAISCGNRSVTPKVRSAVPLVERGTSLYEALLVTGVFPGDVLAMLQTGTFTGNIDALMNCIAEYYEQETALRLHRMSVMLGVSAILIVGILVGLICLKFYGG